jgi:hypothetical protein
MTSMLYNNPQAGLNAYRLLEELSSLYSPAGWVEMHKTMQSETTPEGDRKYPPVYEVHFIPNQMEGLSSKLLAKLEEIAAKFEAKITVKAHAQERYRSPYITVQFKAI